MKPPSLDQFPPAPPSFSAWPWRAELNPPVESSSATVAWPKISIVTPSFNQGQFLEETIRSVLLQGYPNLEFIVIDGGSTDRSVEIIRKYEPWLAYWISEKDRGQPHAINKGWARTTGEIIAWLNSDDWYQPNALWTVARRFLSDPGCMWLVGAVDNSYSPQQPVRRFSPRPTPLVRCLGRYDYGYHQPGTFWRRKLMETVGPLNESYHHCLDHDYWVRSLLLNFEPVFTQDCLAGFRWHNTSKTCSQGELFLKEDWLIFHRYAGRLSREEAAQARRWLLEFEGEAVLTSTYGLLAERRRWQAIRRVLSNLRVLPHLKPPRLGFGALYRTLITGKPPRWFRSQQFAFNESPAAGGLLVRGP